MIWLVTALLAVASPPDTADLAGDERRVVEVEPGTAEDVAKLLRLIPGVEVLLAADPLIEVRAADDILPWLRSAPAVRTVRPAMALEYSLDSQGPAQMGADAWLDLGVTGQGVTVAIVDVGFQNWDAMAAAGEVPDNAVVMRGNDACLSSSRHGTAVAEIVYEMAPDVTFLLYCAQTDPQFLAAIQQIRQDGVDVVNASVGLPNAWADDGSSPWTSAIEASMSEGTVWSVAVGNSLNKWWSGVATDADADGLLEMDGLEALPMNSNVGRTILRVRWDEPFEGASENVDATVMVDGQPCATGARVQDGTISPWEQVVCTGMTGDATLSLSSVSPDAGVGRRFWVWSQYGLPPAYRRTAGSLNIPADMRDGLAVGSVIVNTTNLPQARSEGPTQDGRIKPDLLAPTNVANESYTFFAGTSAAAPHVAGVAALMVEDTEHLWNPVEIRQWMLDQSLDLGPTGPDNQYGYGLLLVDGLPSADNDTEPDTDVDTEPDTEVDTEPDTEVDTEPDTEVDTEPDSDSDPDVDSDSDSYDDADTDDDVQPDTELEPDTDSDFGSDTDSQSPANQEGCNCSTTPSGFGWFPALFIGGLLAYRRCSSRV